VPILYVFNYRSPKINTKKDFHTEYLKLLPNFKNAISKKRENTRLKSIINYEPISKF